LCSAFCVLRFAFRHNPTTKPLKPQGAARPHHIQASRLHILHSRTSCVQLTSRQRPSGCRLVQQREHHEQLTAEPGAPPQRHRPLLPPRRRAGLILMGHASQNAYGYDLDTTYEPELPDAVVPSIPATSAPAYQPNPFSPHVSSVQQPAVAPLAFTGARVQARHPPPGSARPAASSVPGSARLWRCAEAEGAGHVHRPAAETTANSHGVSGSIRKSSAQPGAGRPRAGPIPSPPSRTQPGAARLAAGGRPPEGSPRRPAPRALQRPPAAAAASQDRHQALQPPPPPARGPAAALVCAAAGGRPAPEAPAR
jgi:hypothetical protein